MVGSVIDALRAAGRWDADTYVVLSADHGDMQLEHQMFYKMVPYDGSARVPLVIASPALAGLGAKTVAQPTQLLDIFPTLLGLAGVGLLQLFQGGLELAACLGQLVLFMREELLETLLQIALLAAQLAQQVAQFGSCRLGGGEGLGACLRTVSAELEEGLPQRVALQREGLQLAVQAIEAPLQG